MDERLRFVARLLDGEKMAALCREFVDGADGRDGDVAIASGQLFADLGRTPARLLALELNDQLLDL